MGAQAKIDAIREVPRTGPALHAVPDSLAKGLQKRLRREYDRRLDETSEKVIRTAGNVRRSRQAWLSGSKKELLDGRGPFVPFIGKITEKILSFMVMKPEEDDEYLWSMSMGVIDGRRFVSSAYKFMFISNHAIERFLQRSCDPEDAIALDENAIRHMTQAFSFVCMTVNFVHGEKYKNLYECTLHTQEGSFFLSRKDGQLDESWVIKSYITPEMMRLEQGDQWLSNCIELAKDVREINKNLRNKFI